MAFAIFLFAAKAFGTCKGWLLVKFGSPFLFSNNQIVTKWDLFTPPSPETLCFVIKVYRHIFHIAFKGVLHSHMPIGCTYTDINTHAMKPATTSH